MKNTEIREFVKTKYTKEENSAGIALFVNQFSNYFLKQLEKENIKLDFENFFFDVKMKKKLDENNIQVFVFVCSENEKIENLLKYKFKIEDCLGTTSIEFECLNDEFSVIYDYRTIIITYNFDY